MKKVLSRSYSNLVGFQLVKNYLRKKKYLNYTYIHNTYSVTLSAFQVSETEPGDLFTVIYIL